MGREWIVLSAAAVAILILAGLLIAWGRRGGKR